MRSGFEKFVKGLFKKFRIKFRYEPHKFTYIKEATYTPDFLIGKSIYIETKGYFKPADRTKLKAVKKHNPDLDLRLWFQQDNYLTKRKAKRYSDWARLNGFPYHVGNTLPDEWIAEAKGQLKK